MVLALGSGYGDEVGQGYVIKGYVRVDNIWCKVISQMGPLAKIIVWPTQEEGYIAEYNGEQAHGKTPRAASDAAKSKWWAKKEVEDRLEEVRKMFRERKKIPGTELFTVHGMLTGSCEMGRQHFVDTHNIDLDREYTLKEFVEITGNDYGGETVKRLLKKNDEED